MGSEQSTPSRKCELTIAGHGTHWIQVKIAMRDPRCRVDILAVEGNYITFGNEENVWTMWHHDAENLQRLAEIVRAHPEFEVEYSDTGSALLVKTDPKRRMMCSVTREPNGKCSTNPLHPDGFTIPMSATNDPKVREVFEQMARRARGMSEEKEGDEAVGRQDS